MNLFRLGSQLNNINTYSMTQRYSGVRSNSLYQERKDKGVYEKMAQTNAGVASMQEYIDKLNADAGTLIERLSGQNGTDSSAVIAKFTSGQKLSYGELQELKKTNPQLYAKAVQVEAERKAYEEELKNCKTKEDVQRAKMNRMASVVSQSKTDPVMALARANAIGQVTADFVKSSEYRELPTDAEQAEMLEAERLSREQAAKPNEEVQTKEPEETEEGQLVQPSEDMEQPGDGELPEIELPGKGKTEFHKVAPDVKDGPGVSKDLPKDGFRPHKTNVDVDYAHNAYKQMTKPKK